MSPQQLLERLARTYESATSYVDEGVILSERRDTSRPDEEPFRTWFVRPRLIRLDWSSHHPYAPLRHLVTNYSICSDGLKHTRRSDRPSLETDTEVGFVFAGSPTVTIPNLLLPDAMGAFRFDRMSELRVVGECILDDVPCYQVAGEHPLGSRYDLWISDGDFLLRQVRSDLRTTLEENDTYSGVHYEIFRDIQMNGVVDSSVFSDPALRAPTNSA